MLLLLRETETKITGLWTEMGFTPPPQKKNKKKQQQQTQQFFTQFLVLFVSDFPL